MRWQGSASAGRQLSLKSVILTMKLWKLASFAQIELKKATTPAILGRTLHW
jgi:hypothetical protein